jgi:cyclopropane-fatty-acyl-phospholipid synthase
MSAPRAAETVPRSAAPPAVAAGQWPAALERAPDTARVTQTATAPRRIPLLDRLARRLVLRLLSRMRRGELVLVEEARRLRFGGPGEQRSPSAELHVHSPRFYRDFLRGSLGLGEAYAGGLWDCADLVSLTRIGALNMGGLDTLRRAFSPVLAPLQRTAGWLARNTPARARRRIAAHYDLGNELFSQFLDRTMMYSCAVFDSPAATLEQASLAKLERICAKLKLSPADHVLEIGTGWGGFAEYAAARYGCRVTTTTISAEQHAYASERIRRAGLSDRVTVLFEDYRDPALDRHGPYDKLVSIEMIEAVGWKDFPTFFRTCSNLLEDDGLMLLQAIVVDDRAYEVEKASKTFIRTYVFPNGCLPSSGVIARNVARETDLATIHLEDLTPHYVQTLRHWRTRFEANERRLEELGYDERFRRLWRLYLSYCEAGFAERRIGLTQTVLAKPGWRGTIPDGPLAPADPLPAGADRVAGD